MNNLSGNLYDVLNPVFPLSERGARELSEVSRSFLLRTGEQVGLQGVDGDDMLYVVEGRIAITPPGGDPSELDQRRSRETPFRMPPEDGLVTIEALEPSTFYHVDREKLDFLLFWDELNGSLGEEKRELKRRLAKVRSSLTFRGLPAENIESAIERMQPVTVKAGDAVISQGDQGDSFYLIDSGHAEVWQTGLYDDEPRKVAELHDGDGFGEEALVTGGTRGATVKMTKDGRLLALGRKDFEELVSKPMIREVDADEAKEMMASGARLLDVRYLEEYEESHLPRGFLIPLHDLRSRLGELDPGHRFVVYCRSGNRSRVAALLLTQRGFDAVSLNGGIRDWPYETRSMEPLAG